jgi:hypothetical protein
MRPPHTRVGAGQISGEAGEWSDFSFRRSPLLLSLPLLPLLLLSLLLPLPLLPLLLLLRFVARTPFHLSKGYGVGKAMKSSLF